jgi:hypothetical protein
VNPSRNRKDGAGNPPPTAGAPELHPNRAYGSDNEALPRETGSKQARPNLRSTASVLDPTIFNHKAA